MGVSMTPREYRPVLMTLDEASNEDIVAEAKTLETRGIQLLVMKDKAESLARGVIRMDKRYRTVVSQNKTIMGLLHDADEECVTHRLRCATILHLGWIDRLIFLFNPQEIRDTYAKSEAPSKG